MSLSNLKTFTEADLKKALPSIEKTFTDGKTMIELLTDYFVKNGQIKQQDIPEITSKGGIHGIPQLYKVVIDHWSVDLFASFCRKNYSLLDKADSRTEAEFNYNMYRDLYYEQFHTYDYKWPYQSATLDQTMNKPYRKNSKIDRQVRKDVAKADVKQAAIDGARYLYIKSLTSAKNDLIENYLFDHYELTPTLKDIKGIDFYTKEGKGFDLKNSKGLTFVHEKRLMTKYELTDRKEMIKVVESNPAEYLEAMRVLMSNQGAARFDANDRLFLIGSSVFSTVAEIKAKLDTLDFNHLTNFKTVNFTFGNKQYQSKCALFFL